MTHEPECTWAGTDVQPNHFYKDECFECHIARAAYQRGREDAAEAVEALHDDWKWPLAKEEAERRVIIDLAAYAARGDGA